MIKDTDKRIQDLILKRQLKIRLELHIKSVKEKIRKRLAEQAELTQTLEQSVLRLEELDKLSARALFSSLLGDRKQQYERERQIYLAVYLKLRTCQERIAAKQYEVSVLERKLASMSSVDLLLDKLLHQKKQFLKIKNKQLASEIIGLESSVRILEVEMKEIAEASSAGKRALTALADLLAGLSTILSWEPTPRVLVTTSSIGYKKKSFTRDLLVEIRVADQALDNFLDELQDLFTQFDLDYSRYLSRLSKFADHIFHGLITDWIFYQQIKTSKGNVVETIDQVKRILAMLELDRLDVDTKKAATQEKLNQLVISASKQTK